MTVGIEQNGGSTPLAEFENPSTRLTFWRAHMAPRDFHFAEGGNVATGLKEGTARLIAEAQSNNLGPLLRNSRTLHRPSFFLRHPLAPPSR